MQNKDRKRETEGISVGKKGQKRLCMYYRLFSEDKCLKLCKIQCRKEVPKALEADWSENEVRTMDIKCKKGIIWAL